ncbi:hypothetical protein ACWIGI_24890 [Nocardia sp. NPDC055321]
MTVGDCGVLGVGDGSAMHEFRPPGYRWGDMTLDRTPGGHMCAYESESARLQRERDDLEAQRRSLTGTIEGVRAGDDPTTGPEYVDAREKRTLAEARITEIDRALAARRDSDG